MKIHRFFYPIERDLSGPTVTITDITLVHQVHNVLKLSVGETIELITGTGSDIRATIENINKKTLVVRPIEASVNTKDPTHPTHLCLSILKRENFELAIAKAVECGVTDITPIVCARTIKVGYNTERIERIIKEAVEQCGRNKLPKLHPATDFVEALENNVECVQYICHFGGTHISNKHPDNDRINCIYIGPEGGFTQEEVDLANKKGATTLSLGDRILRAETAAIIAAYHFCNN